MQAHPQHARLNAYHGTKRQLLGNQAGHAAPAWHTNHPVHGKKLAGPSNAVEKGSKILLSRLPSDVGENEVEVLFTKTVGPVKDVFIVYNAQGKSRGAAVISFQRPGDAAIARVKYNGKIVDGRRPIKIEIIKDEDEAPQAAPKPQVPSLLERLGTAMTAPAQPAVLKPQLPAIQTHRQQNGRVNAPRPPSRNPRLPLRQKKGPKRIKKSLAQLDQDIEEYRATAPAIQ
ncbi:hypothetical protein AcV7_002603 [Taiwanofungus camphoratus]|nr:hypothetical protein AcV7_002603 [Antrodia cinnamomea]